MTETMLAAVFKGNGLLELEQRPIPSPIQPDDIVLRVRAVGICGSDLHILDVPPTHPAKPGVIFGHEFCGEVVAVGSAVRALAVGDMVAVDQNPPCGRCNTCRTGDPNFCETLYDNPECPVPGWPHTPGQWWDGGMAEFVRVPAHYAYRVDPSIPAEQVVLAEPLGCVLNGLRKSGVRPGENAVVIGGGPIGLLAVAALKNQGAGQVIVIEPAANRSEVAKAVGADLVINPRETNPVAAVREATQGRGATLILEAVGSQLDASVDMAANQARIVVLGLNSAVNTSFPAVDVTTKELQILGAILMRYTMQEALDLIQSQVLPLEPIVSHVLPLHDVLNGIALARSGQGLKVVFDPQLMKGNPHD
jgi:threonine dehydrogenase-like Zn-dependent dehydrogenase